MDVILRFRILKLFKINQDIHEFVTKCEGHGGQLLIRIPSGRDILTARNCLCLDLGYKSKTARIQPRAAKILKRRSPTTPSFERQAKTTRGGTLSLCSPSFRCLLKSKLPRLSFYSDKNE